MLRGTKKAKRDEDGGDAVADGTGDYRSSVGVSAAEGSSSLGTLKSGLVAFWCDCRWRRYAGTTVRRLFCEFSSSVDFRVDGVPMRARACRMLIQLRTLDTLPVACS